MSESGWVKLCGAVPADITPGFGDENAVVRRVDVFAYKPALAGGRTAIEFSRKAGAPREQLLINVPFRHVAYELERGDREDYSLHGVWVDLKNYANKELGL